MTVSRYSNILHGGSGFHKDINVAWSYSLALKVSITSTKLSLIKIVTSLPTFKVHLMEGVSKNLQSWFKTAIPICLFHILCSRKKLN